MNEYGDPTTSEEVEKWLNADDKKKGIKRLCYFCELYHQKKTSIPQRYPWCWHCAWDAPIVICPECGAVNYVAELDGVDCTECGKNLDRVCVEEEGLLGIKKDRWPKWLVGLKEELDKAYYSDCKFHNQTEVMVTETGEETKRMKQQATGNWVQGLFDTEHKEIDLNTEQICAKYGITEEELELATTGNLRKMGDRIGVGYSAMRKRRQRLLERLRGTVNLMVFG